MVKRGWIEVVCGPMFAGKSEELIRRANRLGYAKKKFLVFKPSIDNRYSEDQVVSHNKRSLKSINISRACDIYSHIKGDIDAVIIDEVQFLDKEVVDVADDLANKGIRVIVGGLDMDFKGQPFENTSSLLARAEKIDKLTAICVVCGEPATRSQRLVNGEPASENDDVIAVSGKESYEPRCRHCHKVKKD